MFSKPQKSEASANIIRFKAKKPLFALPKEPSNEELAFDWTLSEQDKKNVLNHRGSENRLRFAVQLCILRKYGRFLDDYRLVASKIIGYLSSQLKIAPVPINQETVSTGKNYRKEIRDYLGYTTFDQTENLLDDWILHVVSRNFFIENLVQRAEAFLTENKIVIPPPAHFERIINSAYAQAEHKIFNKISSLLSSDIRSAIDGLLNTKDETRRTVFYKFDEFPQEATAKRIAEYFSLYEELAALEISGDLLLGFPGRLITELANAVRSYDAWRLKRFDDNKKYALAACYLLRVRQNIIDNLARMHAQFLITMERKARNRYEEQHRKLRKKMSKSLATFEALAKAFFESSDPNDLGKQIDKDQVGQALETCRQFRKLEEKGVLNILQGMYPNFKRYFPLFLKLQFDAEEGAQYLIEAINVARQYHCGTIKTLPSDVPARFLPKTWQKNLIEDGRINPRTWELGLALAIREALKSGDLFLPDSRHHISFWNMVYSDQEWRHEKNDRDPSNDYTQTVKQLLAEFDTSAQRAIEGLDRNPFINHVKGKIRFHREEAVQEPEEVARLRQLIEIGLPRVRIEHLLMEVDALSGFIEKIRPIDGSIQPLKDRPARLAAIVAHGTNIGIYTMADSNDTVSVDSLRNASKSCIRDDALNEANTVLVNYQKNLEMSALWGLGHISSSDGQRFGINHSSMIASFYPRYFGYYDKAVSVYTHVSDQFSVFRTKVISCAENEAIYVLEGLLENYTSLDIKQHHTDTGGYTDHIFALCHLLGFSYMPRLQNLHKRRLFRQEKNRTYHGLDPLFKGVINFDLIREQWDAMLRVSASLKNRIVPAHVIVQRLSKSSPADRLSKALTELGRLLKTIYILNYMQNEGIRRQVQKQLNLGEQRQNVAKHIFFANQGEFRTGDLTEIMNKASCLSILSNAILVWNTIRITKRVKELRSAGHDISEEHLARISPLMFKHVIVNGAYDFSSKRMSVAF
jgi:TnpA family transposase